MAWDRKCGELAEYFLDDAKYQDELPRNFMMRRGTQALAQLIQNTVDDFLQYDCEKYVDDRGNEP